MSAHVIEIVPVEVVCECAVRIEFDGPLKFPLRSDEIPVVKFSESRQPKVSLGEIWVSRQRLLQSVLYHRSLFRARRYEGRMGIHESHIGASKLRIDLRGPLEVLHCLVPFFFAKSS